ncbi:VOC family protein [Chitinophaga horti]|uniref:VOC family protein n=1 Tax=Chitinophaga horti TaxID=2920382 RepID=A0ABY6IXF6_9BACT|nr:VOC family protein [Chitinophaga horti]UYQ92061.1 VOC family protein [Chitinophaga horti]
MSQTAFSDCITGVQQIGVGVKDLQTSKFWYKKFLGMEVLVFDDKADAPLMTIYTGGKVHSRHALLTLNIAGGGGMEVWQYVSRTPVSADFAVSFGDLGTFAAKIKCNDIDAAHRFYLAENATVSAIMESAHGSRHFWLTDPHGNYFNIVEGHDWFRDPAPTHNVGGVYGAVIGVSDIDKALKLYRDVLGINEVVYDVTGQFKDVPQPAYAGEKYRRVLLRKRGKENGAFSRLLGGVEIELVQCLERTPRKIFEGRYWGDLGFIHLCFDVIDMAKLKQQAAAAGFPFTIDSADSFSMGQAAGRFAYLEDPDGTYIELVETHKVPILKKIGWFLDLTKRKVQKPLPNWMIGCMAWSKVK